MVNAVFAKMDTYLKYGGQESIDLMKLYGSDVSRSGGQNSSRSEVAFRASRPSSQRNTAPVTSDTQQDSEAINNSGGGGNSRRVSMASAKSNNSLEVAFQ